MKKLLNQFLAVLAIALTLASCHAPDKIIYTQDLTPETPMAIKQTHEIRIRRGDKIQVSVNCRDKDIAELFNLTFKTTMSGGMSMSNRMDDMTSYTVDEEGYIEFPIVGKIKVEGCTRLEAAHIIKSCLEEQSLVRDPAVIVGFTNLNYYTMGEITNKGAQMIRKDHLTLLEAIAQAGDLTIDGRRDNVQVLREENGKLVTYVVDITKAEDLVSSPVYELQQDDIIYVTPNSKALYNSTRNGNQVRTYGFWTSIISFGLSILTIFVAIK